MTIGWTQEAPDLYVKGLKDSDLKCRVYKDKFGLWKYEVPKHPKPLEGFALSLRDAMFLADRKTPMTQGDIR